MHQSKDKSIHFQGYSNNTTSEEILETLNLIFKNDVDILVDIHKISQNNSGEKSQYSSDLITDI